MAYTSEIASDKTITIYKDDVAVFIQPTWPDGTEFASVEEAQSWADQAILALVDRTADLAGPNPSQPTIARPVEIDEEDGAIIVEPLAIEETPAE